MANGPELCSLSELLSMVSSKQCLSSSSKLFTLVSHAILIFQQINSCFQFWHNISKQQHNVPSQLRFIMPGFLKANLFECNKEISSSLTWCQLNQSISHNNDQLLHYLSYLFVLISSLKASSGSHTKLTLFLLEMCCLKFTVIEWRTDPSLLTV